MPITRANVKPELLNWAFERAGTRGVFLREKFPKLTEWLAGQDKPTLNQLESFAIAARVPIGYLFLSTPPEERMPIPDLRTVDGQGLRRASPDLLDVIHLCQRRQDWYRDYAAQIGEEAKHFVGSASLQTSPAEVAERMQHELEFGVDERQEAKKIDDALRLFIDKTEAAGILVMVSGMVGSNTSRPLNPQEFRGFALADPVVPLVFVNRVDAEAAQMFTLAHELAHVWLGNSALSNEDLPKEGTHKTEKWCNRVAAEFLVPLVAIQALEFTDPLYHLKDYAKRFKVSTLVILRRLLDAGMITSSEFQTAYVVAKQFYKDKKDRKPDEGGGGNFYNTFPRGASKRLIRALYHDSLGGNTSYGEALQLLGIGKVSTFRELAKKVGAA
jgi:Zn-dependent peptidase ImmA (M78 family)